MKEWIDGVSEYWSGTIPSVRTTPLLRLFIIPLTRDPVS
jgi:hypothetical protein